jgi:hypothetical protein
MSQKAVKHQGSADGEGSDRRANAMPSGNGNDVSSHSNGHVAGDEKATNHLGDAAWPHLDPVIRPIAARDNLARAHHILKDLYVSHPPAQCVERQIEQLIRLPRRIRMPGLFLCGDSGMGKTHLLRRIERRHPEREDPATQRHIRPVLYVQVPAAPTVRTLRRTLIDEANIPFLDHLSRPLPESVLRRGLAAAGTQLIVLDEIHNIEHMKWDHRVLLRDWVRCLSNATQRPIVLAGTEEFESAILGDRQMASRYPIVRLPRWTSGQDLAAFLQGYERACPLRLASYLTDPQLMQALLDETEGITDSIVRSLQAAALVAIREGTERITPDYLSWWRDPPLLTHYGASGGELESNELAMAWLRDQRRDTQPVVMTTAPKFRNRAKISTERKPCEGLL